MTDPSNNKHKDTLSDFRKIIVDMTADMILTFPELIIHEDLKSVVSADDMRALERVYAHCQKVYPDKFFDILYQNENVFAKEDDSEFLPGVHFYPLWKENLSDKTRNTIWKYLQLILFAVVSDMTDGKSFGDASKLFEAINEDEFKSKLEETIQQMHDLFGASAENSTTPADDAASPEGPGFAVPDPKDIHDHVTNMMKGKLGSLAQEIAAETAAEMGLEADMENASSMNDVFKNLMKNPTKLMGLVQSVGSKLDQKLKSGDMKESELLQEASEILQKMKNMPGMSSMQSMFEKMGMGHMMPGGAGGGGGGQKVNVNAMQSQLQRNLKGAKTKERMLSKLAERQAQQQQQQQQAQQQQAQQQQPAIFQKGEKPERSTAEDNPYAQAAGPSKPKKHKKKVK